MKILKLVNLLFFGFIFLAAIFLFVLSLTSLVEFLKEPQFFYPPSFINIIALPSIFSAVAFLILFKIVKIIQAEDSVLSKKHPVRTVLITGCFIFSLWFIYNLFHESPPDLFPFDDPEATYSINKIDDIYYLSYKATSDRNKHYICEWPENGEKRCSWETNKDISGVTIGKSPVDLELFLNNDLRLDGSFAYSDKQCIVNICKDFQRRLVVDINSIEAISSQK